MKSGARALKTIKEDILTVSERLMKIHGYENTTFDMIAGELGISNATISYYYKNKRWILFWFFKKYVDLLSGYITKNLPANPNYYLASCIINNFFYREVMKTKENWNLFYTKENPMIAAPEYLDKKEESYKRIVKDFHTDISDDEIHTATMMENAVKISLYKEHDKLDGSMPADKFCYYDNLTIGYYMGIDSRLIRENMHRAVEYADSHTPPSIFLLS